MLKKIFSAVTAIVILVALVVLAAPATLAASASLTGTKTVRAGDTITVTLNVGGTNIVGGQGTLSYDTSLLTLKSTTKKISSPWSVDVNGNVVMFADESLESPINSTKAIISVKFQIKSSVDVGTKITVSMKNCVLTDTSYKGHSVSVSSYSATVASPLSKNALLSSLTVANAQISPAFDPDVGEYTANVGFDVTCLEISAKAAESSAKISINSPELPAGQKTAVTIKVTAESGAVNTYTIMVTRAQDPNYVADSNSKLYALIVEDYFISPGFSPDVTEYVVWLPFETTFITVQALPEAELAVAEVKDSTRDLAVGDNLIHIVCRAEDGTETEYVLNAHRSEKYPPSASSDSAISSLPNVSGNDDKSAAKSGVLPIWLTLALCAVCAVSGFAASRLIPQKGFNEKDYRDDE